MPLLPRSALAAGAMSAISTSTSTSTAGITNWSARAHQPCHPSWPYQPADFTRLDPGADGAFYAAARFVTHIDDAAIARLRAYYAAALPRRGRLLDFCSSWISHYPPEIEEAARAGALQVLGTGLNAAELAANPVLARCVGKSGTQWPLVRDLNAYPDLGDVLHEDEVLDAATCVVSIDYLTRPREVLEGLRKRMKKGGTVHLVVSNRCFPTKVIARWLRIGEEERLNMVGGERLTLRTRRCCTLLTMRRLSCLFWME
ncbi:uncharacterized protein K452DRAFT_286972 [Aplosporella prunicola CBS 121167]|uniref:Methyltransferase type 11 domain-containing protein n=1 Tax=Aplosporella prunicola CBS 121167 TaxID=1176127 RepID=A0A6A6BGV2_9PEZI|nr:uncharacterized protein K452DRAFT_286972 [Aplosporella prunicola CBS 121167]KAF2142545.1 hypothetical protein K452DRAFT_286972 [Aplosporella prunicola CBS 121167]